jgi:O-antigen/teichoic acid export membrane protein
MSVRFVFGSAAAYLAVTMAERVGSLLLIPLLTRVLTPTDYGAILLITNSSALINLLFGYSSAQALLMMFANAGSDDDRRNVCTTILASIVVILSLLHSTVALFARPISQYFLHTTAYETTIALGALASFLGTCSGCLSLIGRLAERHRLYLLIQLPAVFILVGLTVWLLLVYSMGVNSQYIAVAVAAAVTASIYALTLRRWLSGHFDRHLLARAGRISAQMLPWQFATVLATNSAAFFLTRSGHVEEAGLFMVASAVAGLLLLASTSFESVWTTFVLLRKNEPSLATLQIRIFSLYSSALLVGASALCLFARELFEILVGPAFREGYRLVPALALAYCIFCLANSFSQGLQAKQRMLHYTWIGVLASAVFLALCLPLVGHLGAPAIIVAMGGSFLTMLIALQIVSNRLMPVPYPWARHALMWMVAVAIVALVYPLPMSWHGLAAKLAMLIAIVCLPFMFGAVRMSDLQVAKGAIFAPTR